jgi:hypothetical protein
MYPDTRDLCVKQKLRLTGVNLWDLSDVTAQLKDIKLETQRVAEERDETIKMTAYKMEELEQQTKEGNANF